MTKIYHDLEGMTIRHEICSQAPSNTVELNLKNLHIIKNVLFKNKLIIKLFLY